MFFTSKFKWEKPSLMATMAKSSKQFLLKNHFQVPLLPSIEAQLTNQSQKASQTEKQPLPKLQEIIVQDAEEQPINEEKQDAEELLDRQLLNDPQRLLRKIISIMKEISMLRNGKTNQYVQLNNSLKHYQSLKAEADYKAIGSNQNECS